MTLEEIKESMARQGITMKGLAETLGVSYDSFRQILAGQRKMTLQLERHIARVLGEMKSQMFIVTVDFPEVAAKLWTPGFSRLNAEDQKKAAIAAAQSIVEILKEKGAGCLSEDELAALENLNLPGGGLPTVGGSAPAGTISEPYPEALAPMA